MKENFNLETILELVLRTFLISVREKQLNPINVYSPPRSYNINNILLYICIGTKLLEKDRVLAVVVSSFTFAAIEECSHCCGTSSVLRKYVWINETVSLITNVV